jgi:predicted DCC family thiol-disulfide oxidoreductase YuxK
MTPPAAPQVTVWYDNACPLCSREIAVMRRLDRRGAIHFVDACDPDAACPIDRRDILARFHAAEDGRLLSGAAAFAAMWRAIPVLRPLGVMAGWPGFDRGFEWLYLRFLAVRPLLQRALR